jgi:5-methylcytosine-specific restriction endonuclease McrA
MNLNQIKRAKFGDDTKDKVFKKTSGCCHICHQKLVYKNYGMLKARTPGNWEIDHSKPVSKGGKNHLNNFLPACISCNRSKGNASTASARAKNGLSSAPLSNEAKMDQARNRKLLKVGAAGLVGLRFGPAGAILGIAIAVLSE